MMYELLHLGVPTWFIQTKHDSNIHMVEKGLASLITLDMLAESDFDPWKNILICPQKDDMFTEEGIPERVLKIASTPIHP